MSVAIIAAVAENGVIGAGGEIPWHISEDLKRFKSLTVDKVVIMGRKTFESITKRLGKPLPERTNVVITRDAKYSAPDGVETFSSLDAALQKHHDEEVFIIGGGEIYAQALSKADTLYITHVEKTVEGDVYFPKISPDEWKSAGEEKRDGYRFAVYRRKVGKR